MKGDQTRAKFVETAARLFQSQGYHGAGLAQIIEESGGPKGSFYFHFKGGKVDLALATIERSRTDVAALLTRASERTGDAEAYVRAIARGLKRWLRDSAFSAGCPVAGLTLELAASSPQIASACENAYTMWTQQVADDLMRFGMEHARANSFAPSIIACFEGGVVMCRAMRSVRPLDHVAATLGLALSGQA